MSSQASHCGTVPFLHETYPPNSWLQHLCPELQVALLAIMTVDPIKVAQLGIADVRDPALMCVLDRAPSAEALAAARRATSSYRLNHRTDAIGCAVHRESLVWDAPPAAPSLARRLLALVGR